MAALRTAAPMGRSHRVSSDSAWPLRGADGLTFAQRKAASPATSPALSPDSRTQATHSGVVEVGAGERDRRQ